MLDGDEGVMVHGQNRFRDEKVPVLMSFLPNLGSLSYPKASPEYGAEQDEDPILIKQVENYLRGFVT